ncbi:ser thr protein phosphatase family protein, putative, partial [Ichthyophthirius multifiliis]
VKQIKPPVHRPLSKDLMWGKHDKPNWKQISDHLQKEGKIDKENLIKLIYECNRILKNEPNLLQMSDPVTVVGDIHGQFYDLLKILEVGGNPSKTKYLFLGDFVDRGSFSIEVLILLYSLKINYPSSIYFLRGNHECRQMTSFFNFLEECKYKYDQEIYQLFMDSFDLLPLSCILNDKFIAFHGGISPELKSLEDIRNINRFKEPPKIGLFCDILWSDPVDNENGNQESIYRQNEVRGCSYFYGNNAVKRFLNDNNLISVIRAHEAQLEGYKMHKWNGQDFPMVITIFSAPNYCDVYNNKGAVIKFENNTLNIQQYNFTPHPYMLPNFMDIFTWSIPFVSEKITEIIHCIIQQVNDDDQFVSGDDLSETDNKKLQKYITNQNQQNPQINNDKKQLVETNLLRNKIKFISKMAKLQNTLREERENIIRLKNISSDNKIPQGVLTEGVDGIQNGFIFILNIIYSIFNKNSPKQLLKCKKG